MSLSYTVRTDRYLQERGSNLNMPLRQYCELLKKVEVLNKKDPHWSLKYRKAIAYCGWMFSYGGIPSGWAIEAIRISVALIDSNIQRLSSPDTSFAQRSSTQGRYVYIFE